MNEKVEAHLTLYRANYLKQLRSLKDSVDAEIAEVVKGNFLIGQKLQGDAFEVIRTAERLQALMNLGD